MDYLSYVDYFHVFSFIGLRLDIEIFHVIKSKLAAQYNDGSLLVYIFFILYLIQPFLDYVNQGLNECSHDKGTTSQGTDSACTQTSPKESVNGQKFLRLERLPHKFIIMLSTYSCKLQIIDGNLETEKILYFS